MLGSQAPEAADAPKGKGHGTVGFGVSCANTARLIVAAEPARRRLVLQPRSKPLETEIADAESPAPGSDVGGSEEEATPEVGSLTEETASKKIAEGACGVCCILGYVGAIRRTCDGGTDEFVQ